MKPFEDDSASEALGELSFENGRQSITIAGRLAITRDRQGLEHARWLADIARSVVLALEGAEDLPARIDLAVGPSQTVKNPFG